MKKVVALGLALVFGAINTFAEGEKDGKLVVDNNQSTIVWTGEKVTGQHTGNLGIKNGVIVVENDEIVESIIELDMSTITCTDLEDPEYNAKLVGHLKSSDFFDVEKHKTAKFVLKKFIPSGNNDGMYEAKGELTIKGISKPISFPVKTDMKDGKIYASADLTFDRSLYDIKFRSGSFFENLGDNLIYDDVKVSFNIVADSAK